MDASPNRMRWFEAATTMKRRDQYICFDYVWQLYKVIRHMRRNLHHRFLEWSFQKREIRERYGHGRLLNQSEKEKKIK